jgi:hypothetical protein
MEDMSLMRDYGKRVGVKITGKKAADAKAAVMLGILDAANKAKAEKDKAWVEANKDLIDWYNANCEAPSAGGTDVPETKAPAEKKGAAKKGGNGKKDALAEAKAKAEAAKAKAAEEKAGKAATKGAGTPREGSLNFKIRAWLTEKLAEEAIVKKVVKELLAIKPGVDEAWAAKRAKSKIKYVQAA